MIVKLDGCATQPLGSYLKAMAVLRLVSEQLSPGIRGGWRGGVFELEGELSEDELVTFFVESYRPTPILAPWNGGSGFYPKDRKVGIEAIAGAPGERFREYREAIEIVRALPDITGGKAANAKDDAARRTRVLLECRNRLPDSAVEWLDATISLAADGERSFSPILGTGGNEGRLDYTNNFMERLAELLIVNPAWEQTRRLLRNALFGEATQGLQPAAVGQYDPGRAGGPNQAQDIESPDFPVNPWNFVLTLEGAVAWAGGVYRKQGTSYKSTFCSPFTVRASAVGYGSAADSDRGASRAEIWAPIWKSMATYAEVRGLLREGRAEVGGKPARTGLEFAEAACGLGVDRGITGFVRYNLLKRRGDSYVALPAGEFGTGYRSSADLVRQLMTVVEAFDRMPQPPTVYEGMRRQLDRALFDVLMHGGADHLMETMSCFGRLVRLMLTLGKKVHVERKLEAAWIQDAECHGEVRIAAAVASLSGIRANLDRNNDDFAWTGGDLAERLTAVLERRLLRVHDDEREQRKGGSTYPADLESIDRFLAGDLDDERIENLIFAYLYVRMPRPASPRRAEVPASYAVLRLLFLGIECPDGQRSAPDATVVAALRAGDVEFAVELASRKLRNRRVDVLEVDYGSGAVGAMRLAASLLIPIRAERRLRDIVTREPQEAVHI